MYIGYLQYVSWCTNIWVMFMHVWFMFVHLDVIIGYMTFLPNNWMCVWYRLCES